MTSEFRESAFAKASSSAKASTFAFQATADKSDDKMASADKQGVEKNPLQSRIVYDIIVLLY